MYGARYCQKDFQSQNLSGDHLGNLGTGGEDNTKKDITIW